VANRNRFSAAYLNQPENRLTQLTSFEKRLKRQVVSKPAEFFAATAPGLEPLCLQELQTLSLSTSGDCVTTGGVTFTGHLQDCFLANLCLRSANRVLMRIGAFTASNFSTLEKKLAAIPWELYLHSGRPLRFHVTARHSRLYHSGAIAERFKKAIDTLWDKAGVDPKPNESAALSQRIFIRVVDDQFAVSLDSSGESLYRRGLKKHVTAAPLRETIAAAMLILAGYSPSEPLVDPMCGAGSFSLEAAMRAHNIPAGWFRDFAFSGWPAFALTRKRWDYIRKGMQPEITATERATIFAADVDPAACNALERNSAAAGFSKTIRVATCNFFDLVPEELSLTPGLVTMNPPFGRRIGSLKQSDRKFKKLFKHLKAKWRGWKVGLVVPRQSFLEKVPFPTMPLSIRHGGLRFYLVTGRIPK
jgi:putative N6-adenine-specific DNA methylase